LSAANLYLLLLLLLLQATSLRRNREGADGEWRFCQQVGQPGAMQHQ
jgi:hypothetical protein